MFSKSLLPLRPILECGVVRFFLKEKRELWVRNLCFRYIPDILTGSVEFLYCMVQYIGFVFYGTYMYHSRLSKIIFKKSAWENSRYFATPPLVSPRMTSARGTTAEIPYWFHNDVTTLIWVVPLVGWNNISRGKGQSERYPDLDSDVSSVWNFCASSLGPVQTSNLTCAEPNTYLGQPPGGGGTRRKIG